MHFQLVPESVTLDDFEWWKCTLAEKKAFYGAHLKSLIADRLILSAAKCRTMILVSRNIKHMRRFSSHWWLMAGLKSSQQSNMF